MTLGQTVTGAEPCTVSPEDVEAMAVYLDVPVQRGRPAGYHVLEVAKEAACAPVLPPWEQRTAENGNAVFYNSETQETSERHPLDAKYLRLAGIWKRRGAKQGQGRSWMLFKGRDGAPDYYYDFKTGNTAEEVLPEKVIPPVPRALIPRFAKTTPTRGETAAAATEGGPGLPPGKSRALRPPPPEVAVLRLRTWGRRFNKEGRGVFHDNGEVLHEGLMQVVHDVQFDMATRMVTVRDSEGQEVASGEAQAMDGSPCECWDMYVGGTICIGDRKFTLMQASAETQKWIDAHGEILLMWRETLLAAATKYTRRAQENRVSCKVPSGGGKAPLRLLIRQLELLLDEHEEHRPQQAESWQDRLSVYFGE
ncbi:unnamed protein product [Pedinophyceae sp. YPF-701]|nr:unnamed protein product [Pedinophyceae sp. YPF-701]